MSRSPLRDLNPLKFSIDENSCHTTAHRTCLYHIWVSWPRRSPHVVSCFCHPFQPHLTKKNLTYVERYYTRPFNAVLFNFSSFRKKFWNQNSVKQFQRYSDQSTGYVSTDEKGMTQQRNMGSSSDNELLYWWLPLVSVCVLSTGSCSIHSALSYDNRGTTAFPAQFVRWWCFQFKT